MKSKSKKGSSPVVLVIRSAEKLIGLAPLVIKKKFGIRFVSFLFDFWFSPDFILDSEYRGVCMKNVADYVFGNLGCKLATFSLPADSSSIRILQRICKDYKICFHKENEDYINHRVILVNCSWDVFQKSRGKYFRQDFRRVERELNNLGPWQTLLFENMENQIVAFNKIVTIEKRSWKQDWRLQKNVTKDEQLFQIWEGGGLCVETCPGFKRSVYFLELNGRAIAYSLVIQYKDTAYVAKTSFDQKYKKFYPGIYIINCAIRDLFINSEVKKIDFMTNLPFVKKWASDCNLRFNFVLSRGFLIKFFHLFAKNQQIRRVMKFLMPKVIFS